ncbi:MAG: ACP S-malonyltransferase [Endomicrobium sp.]|jgi:[acyl-carrier-protein] S-malonyltransferase|nr:ACP S-malonyltransferase [Endomicrobium sp.]
MHKIVFMFPGQGAQYIGMGQDFYHKYDKAKAIIDLLDNTIKETMFKGPLATLNKTQYTQPSVFIVSCAIFEIFQSYYNFKDDDVIAIGHSLGEYSALCTTGFFNVRNGLKIVLTRAKLMQKVTQHHHGAMVALIGSDDILISNACREICTRGYGICEVANFNSKHQVVISGEVNAVKETVKYLKSINPKLKAIYLNVNGAFHSSLMTYAVEKMRFELSKYDFNIPKFGIYMNYDALFTFDVNSIKEKLIQQIDHPVRWEESIKNIIRRGYNTFIEIGPGRVLSNLVRRIDTNKFTRIFNIENIESLESTLEAITK